MISIYLSFLVFIGIILIAVGVIFGICAIGDFLVYWEGQENKKSLQKNRKMKKCSEKDRT